MSVPVGVEIATVIVTFAPLTVPAGVIEAAGGSLPSDRQHCLRGRPRWISSGEGLLRFGVKFGIETQRAVPVAGGQDQIILTGVSGIGDSGLAGRNGSWTWSISGTASCEKQGEYQQFFDESLL